jgi:hypothetical protein
MRIVIEGEHGTVVQTDRRPADAVQVNVIDAGPPPATLLRRFGRAPTQAMMQIEGGAAPSKRRAQKKTVEETPLNPLRAGEAIARARYGPKPGVSDKRPSADSGLPKRSPRKTSPRKRKK